MQMIHVLSARLPSDVPVAGVPLEPYVLVRRPDGTTVSAGKTQFFSPAYTISSPNCLSIALSYNIPHPAIACPRELPFS